MPAQKAFTLQWAAGQSGCSLKPRSSPPVHQSQDKHPSLWISNVPTFPSLSTGWRKGSLLHDAVRGILFPQKVTARRTGRWGWTGECQGLPPSSYPVSVFQIRLTEQKTISIWCDWEFGYWVKEESIHLELRWIMPSPTKNFNLSRTPAHRDCHKTQPLLLLLRSLKSQFIQIMAFLF